MSADEGTRWVFEMEKTYQIGFSCMFMGDLTGQSGIYGCTVLFRATVAYIGKKQNLGGKVCLV